MATPYRVSRVSTPYRALVALALAVPVALLVPGSSAASGQPTVPQVEQEVAALNQQADIAVEAYDAGQLTLQRARAQASQAERQAGAAERALTVLENQTAGLASAVYQEGGIGTVSALLTTRNPQTLLNQLGDLDQIASSSSAALAALTAASQQVQEARVTARQQEARAASAALALTEAKNRILGLLAQQQALLGSLQAQQRAAVLAAEAAPASAATYAPPPLPADASVIAREALAAAYSAIGRPYQWGGAGPYSFDCSGLVMWSFAHAGVSLPHSAAAQYDYGVHIPIPDLQPGDIVFYDEGGYIGHDGIYVGNGEMIDAPHTGAYVGIHALYPGLIGGTRL